MEKETFIFCPHITHHKHKHTPTPMKYCFSKLRALNRDRGFVISEISQVPEVARVEWKPGSR